MEKTAMEILHKHFHHFKSERTRGLVIKCMEAYASQFKQPSAWISVEDDRKPVIPPPYYEGGCKITPMGVQILVYDSLEYYVYEDSYSGEFSNSYITHWQPLPTPPSK